MTDASNGHAERALAAIRAALTRVPFYAKQGLAPPADGAPLDEVLRALPLLTRDRIRATLPKTWVPGDRDVKAELAAGNLTIVETGAAEARVRVLFDAAWWRAQEARALTLHPRAASALAGDMGAYRDAVLWVPEKGTGSCGSGDPGYGDRVEGTRLHLNSRQDPTFWSETVMTRMLDELAQHETVGLLADPFYLDVLARHAAEVGRTLDVRGFVVTTRAMPTTAHRAAIRRAYAGPVVDVFSAREVGTLFVEGEDGKMHHTPSTHVELLRATVPCPGANDVALVVVTTLDREVQPLVRYVLGDLVQIADGERTPGAVPSIASVEGRVEDTVVRPDGALVTPRALDRALAGTEQRAYQVVQRAADAVELEIVGGSADAARDAVAPLLVGMRVTARSVSAIAVDADGKFRTSRRHVPLALSAAFEGCEGAMS